jgi:serine phosphatase RsbU (regulator of sigma subunit)
MAANGCGAGPPVPVPERSVWRAFREAIVYMDCLRWADGGIGSVAVRVDAPVGPVSTHLASVRSAVVAAAVGDSLWSAFETLLIALAVLFLIIQGAAIVLGGMLARSITSAIHELFIGTERVQQGDFTHRIPIESRDQLGALATSFNRMSESIQTLLLVQREKQRLDEELRIAREIQKSLLPVRPPRIADLDIADLCEPAREVGGDYYDFFDLGPRQIGVLVADVSGKGTSAALYMAELKGLMLALSHVERSPRRLLIALNRQLAEHLDNRSFITMTYAVINLDQRTITWARAGHTPLIVVSGGASEIVVSDGMVLGLRLPGAAARFDEVLEERTRPLVDGDVLVLYTDGITEAMDAEGDLFGDDALARILSNQHQLDAAGIRERVVRDVGAFVGAAEPHDDMTMVIIKVRTEAGRAGVIEA